MYFPQRCHWPESSIYYFFYGSSELFQPISDFELEHVLVQSEIQAASSKFWSI